MKAYVNGKVFTGKKILDNSIVLTENGKVKAVLTEGDTPSHAEKIDLNGNLLAPALIDIQIYGGNGHLFGEFPSVDALRATYEYCLSGGATHFLPTVATNSEQVMLAAIEAVRDYWQQGGKGVVGLHLEGPYINVEKRGAHLKQYIVPPSVESVKKLLSIGKGIIKIMTLAPEVCTDEVIQLLQNQGVILSAGHTNATYQQATNAFNKGIKLATHLYNAMSPLQHREPGVVGAIFDHKKVCVSAVADGYHVDFAALRIAKKVLKERLFLITDAVTESLNGLYTHRLQGDKYVIADGTLSGSALTMLQAVKNCVAHIKIPIEEALRMASLYPAKAVGLDKKLGRIEAEYDECFILIDNNWQLKSVFY